MSIKFENIFLLCCTLLIFGTACNRPVKKDLPKEKEHPKLIHSIGNPGYGNVQCAMQDKAGNLWFGTTQNGLYKYDGKSFMQFLVADGININNVWSLLEDKDGKIWIGTEDGLCLYDGKTFAKIEIPLAKNQLPNKNRKTQEVFSMMQDKTGKLWFATIDGVYRYDGKSFTLLEVSKTEGGYMSSNNNKEKMLEDKEGNIWFGGRANEGVYRYDGKSVTNIKLKDLFQKGPKPKPHNWAWPQLQDKNGNIWFSNWGGVYKYDGKSFTTFTESDGLNTDAAITKIIEDRNGNIWLGGAGGLSRYDGKSFTHFKDGLINPWIWEILEDKNGNLWVCTRATGLYLFDGKKFIVYSEYKKQPVAK